MKKKEQNRKNLQGYVSFLLITFLASQEMKIDGWKLMEELYVVSSRNRGPDPF